MAEFLALNKPPVLVMDIRARENWKKFKQKYEVYVVATGEESSSGCAEKCNGR